MQSIMTMEAKNQYLHTLITRHGGYHLIGRKEKSRLLDEYCRVTGQHRKYVIRKITSGRYVQTMRTEKGERTRTRRSYYDGNVMRHLITLWNIFDRPCGQRMIAQIKTELARLQRFGEITLSAEMEEKLHRISAREVDNTLHAHKEKERLLQKYGKKTHPLLYQKIPVRIASAQNRTIIGNIQIDLVEHCGQSAEGAYIYTLSTTDLATNWWEGGAVLTKSMKGVGEQLDGVRQRYPFPWNGFHADNDSAFINAHLYRYAQNEELAFTRSRPYEKNDNFLVEQKNGRVVRRGIGYRRHDTAKELQILNELYPLMARYQNFFQPVMKLKEKKRIGSKVKRTFEKPKTPYQKVCEDRHIAHQQKKKLKALYALLNPAALKRQIDRKRDELLQAYRAKGCTASLAIELAPKQVPASVTFLHCRTEAVSVT